MRRIRGFEPPIQIGNGVWAGFGAQSASAIEYRLPPYDALSSVHMRMQISIVSTSSSTRCGAGGNGKP